MWILLTLLCAATQATWMALSKLRLQTLGRLQFTVFLRVPIVLLMLPLYLAIEQPSVSTRVWGLLCLVSALECARLFTLATGFRKDYYATYALMNTAPMWVLLMAPQVLGERLSLPVVAGGVLVVAGGFVFYRTGRFVPAGLLAAVIEALIVAASKLALSESQAPIFYMFWMYSIAAIMLTVAVCARVGVRQTWADYRRAWRPILPLNVLNLVAMVTYMGGLHLAAASHFAILMRSNLVFGFALSLFLLRELEGWKWKLVGALFIVAGAALITAV